MKAWPEIFAMRPPALLCLWAHLPAHHRRRTLQIRAAEQQRLVAGATYVDPACSKAEMLTAASAAEHAHQEQRQRKAGEVEGLGIGDGDGLEGLRQAARLLQRLVAANRQRQAGDDPQRRRQAAHDARAAIRGYEFRHERLGGCTKGPLKRDTDVAKQAGLLVQHIRPWQEQDQRLSKEEDAGGHPQIPVR